MKRMYTLVIALLLMTFCAKAQTLLNESFDGGVLPAGWTMIDQDGDSYNWSFTQFSSEAAHSGTGCAASASYINNVGALHPQNWLITPAVTITSANTTLSWYAGDYGYPEPLEVLVSTTGNTVADFTSPAIFSNSITSDISEGEGYASYSVQLGSYVGQTVYIAFVHRNSYDNYWLLLDDIKIFAMPSGNVIDADPLSLSFGNVEVGANQVLTSTVVGYNLTSPITATTAAPFQVSADGTTFATTATLAAAGGTLFVRYNPTTIGADSGIVTLSSTGAADITIDLFGEAFECNPITNFPFVEDFSPTSANRDCWQVIDANNDGKAISPIQIQTGVFAALYMYSETSAANDWLISPELVLDSNMRASFDYITAGQFGPERYSVYVIGQGQTYANATNVLTTQQVTNSAWASQSIDLSSYANQTIRLAVKVESAADRYWIAFSNFVVYDQSPHTVTVVASDNTMGSVSGNGTFTAGASDTLTATANTGYRFTGWSDGNTENPRVITVLTDVTYTANFADLGDDILQYDNGVYKSNMGAGGTLYWGVRFEASELTGYSNLSSVQLFDAYPGTYDVRIYQGGTTAPGTQIYNQSFALTGSASWYEAQFTAPVTLDPTQPLWVVIYNSGTSYPASATDFVGNPDGSWVSTDGSTWAPIYSFGDYYLTWMIRAVLGQNAETYTLTVTSADETMGTVTGGGTYNDGDTATLTAAANPGYHFVQWNDGNTDNPRTVVVTGDATYTATFASDATTTYTITVTSANETMGTVTGGGTYEAGTVITIEAIANPNYEFVSWNDDNTENPRQITVTQDQTFVASFRQKVSITDFNMDDVAVYSHNHQIVVDNVEGYSVEIYNMAGQLVISDAANAQSKRTYSMTSDGIYIVRVGHELSKKVVVTK